MLFTRIKLTLTCLLFSTIGAYAADKDFLIQAGVGTGFIDYGHELDLADNDIEENYSVFGLVRAGYSFFNSGYVTAVFAGNRHIIDTPNSINIISSGFYGAGVLVYPFNTGFFCGGSAAGVNIDGEFTSNGETVKTTDTGFGAMIDAGYDFDSDNSGFSLSMNSSYFLAMVEESLLSFISFYVCINLK